MSSREASPVRKGNKRVAGSGRLRRRQQSFKKKVKKMEDICNEISDDFGVLADVLKEISESLE